MAILARVTVTPSESDKVRHSAVVSENLTIISHNLLTVQDRR